MADDKSVLSFLILFLVGYIVSYGSCAPVEEKIVLDNGTVLTMVIHDVKEAPPLRYDSALDASHTDEAANPNIIIHEAQYPPAPRVISKRSADDETGDDDPNFEIKTEEPILAPPPRSDSEKKLSEVSPPGAVAAAAAVQTTIIVVPKPDEPVANDASIETKRVTQPSKSEAVHEKSVSQPGGGDAKKQDDDGDGDDKEEKTATPIALPTISTGKVDGSGKNDSKVGSNDERDAKPAVEDGGSTPSGEISVNIKSTTEKKIDEVVDKKPPGDDERKDKDITTKPSVNTPSDEDSDDDDDQTNNKGDDDGDDDGNDEDGDGKEKDNKSSLDANGDGKPADAEGEDDVDDDYGEDDDPNAADLIADKNAKPDGNEDEDAEPDDDDEDEDDDKSLIDGNKGKPISGETSETEGLKKNTSDEPQSSGHFMSYFLIAVVFVACFYLIFHNRQKIKAYVLEGKTGRGRRRKAGNSEYRQLSTADEVLPDTDKGIESKTTYTY